MVFRFGTFTLDCDTGLLTGPEETVSLRPQTCKVLEVLLKHAPELVDRNTLLDEAWGRTALSPSVLPQTISELRQALGDPAHASQYIETMHKRGYRVIVPVEELDTPGEVPASAGVEQGNATAAPSHRRLPLVVLSAAVLVLGAAAIFWWQDSAQRRWLDAEALPEIRSLIQADVFGAWRLAHRTRRKIENSPQLEQLWLDLTLPVTLTSEPSGALIEVDEYRRSPGRSRDQWISLGRTPLEDVRLPLSMLRFRVTLEGHAPIEAAPSFLPQPETFYLHEPENTPDGMVFVPAGSVHYLLQQRNLPGFWIDRHEVTNSAYREFVEDGGYRKSELWPELVDIDGRSLDRSQLLELLVDSTGIPGPATWALGTYPEGLGDHPVEGVSWYEASAFAAWAGKQLPTVYHWYRAAGLGTPQAANFSDIIAASNFNGLGTVPVGSLGGVGPYGTYDMAGNVSEWCLNSAGTLRHGLGAAWMDNSYQFSDVNAFDPLARRAGSGFRLITQDEPLDPELAADLTIPEREVTDPVDDDTFARYAGLYAYDNTPLDPIVEEIDDSHEAWRRERVSYAAAYPGERVTAQIFLPNNSEPPYQTIVHFPGGDALLLGSSRDAGLLHVEPFLRTGRAVVYPVYQGTFERKSSLPPGPNTLRDQIIQQIKDLRRTVDYLETRSDIDRTAMAFHGLSYGGSRGPFALAIEDRFHTGILVSTGLWPSQHLPAEIHPVDYLPRIQVPVLLIGGREDFNFPYESSQRPFFDLIGTAPDRKRHVALDYGHLPPGYTEVTRALLEWTDRWLGPVDVH